MPRTRPLVETTGDDDIPQRDELSPEITTLGRYLLEDRLGKGGMGEVFRALDPELDRPVAIKRLIAWSDDDEARVRLHREGQAIARLSHTNVVQVYDVGRDAKTGDMFIAMELVDGVTLRQWLRAGDRTFREICEVYVQAGEGLLAAHEQGIVHRDFKPENVLVGYDGIAKVVDFGLAKPAGTAMPTDEEIDRGDRKDPRPRLAADEQLSDASGSSGRPTLRRSSGRASPVLGSDITPVGARLGTPAYMPPEQSAGTPATPRADQFSFAVALFEALAGYLPFPGDGPAEYAISVLDGQMLEFPRGSAVPGRLQRAIYRALDPDPHARFATLRPLLDELGRDPIARRKRAVRLGGAVALGGTLALGIAELARPTDALQERCSADAAAIDAVWNADVSARTREAIASIDVPFAIDTATRSTEALDRASASWRIARLRWCGASTTDEERPQARVQLTIGACLDRVLARERELVDSLAAPDVETITHAVDAIERLQRELSRCDEPAYLAQFDEEDGEDQAAHRHALERLAQARQRHDLGQHASGLRALDDIDVATLSPAIALEHRMVRGALEKARGNPGRALAELELGAQEGLGAAAPLLAAEWNNDYADLQYELGALDRIAKPYQRAFELRRRELGPDHIDTLLSDGCRGHEPYARGDYGTALERYRAAAERAKAVASEVDGTRILLDEWVAQALSHTGDLEQARAATEDLVARLRESRGATHPRTLDLLETLAIIELRAEHNEPALEHFRTALEGRPDVKHGGDPVDRATTLANIGAALTELGRRDEAVRSLERALDELTQAGFGPEHPKALAIEANLVELHRRSGRIAQAIDGYERLLERMHASGFERTTDGLQVQLNFAAALGNANREREAVEVCRRAIELARATGDTVMLGKAQLRLGRSLDLAGDRPAADRALSDAHAAFAGQPDDAAWVVELRDYQRER
ncbi:MAG TPA: serine/threonine-protein kinase [Nannocystaceae bacterium]|nr:serine/threonine-protein kinase [Nannocystaceae bacterium]